MREILPTVTPALICLSYRRGVIHADETHSDPTARAQAGAALSVRTYRTGERAAGAFERSAAAVFKQ